MDPATRLCLVSSEGTEFPVSKGLLTEHSDFFKAMFNSGMKECKEERINLPTVSGEGLSLALDFVNKTQLLDTVEAVAKVIEVATYLQMSKLTENCSQQLIGSLSSDSWARIHKIADAYMLEDVKEATLGYMRSNFHMVTADQEFNELSIKTFTELLSSELHILDERDVFKVALQWLTMNKLLDDPDIFTSVLDCVRFPLLQSLHELEECIKDLKAAGLDERCAVFSDIATAKECLLNPMIILEKDLGKKVMSRRMMTCALALGGFTKSESTTNRIMLTSVESLCIRDVDTLHWRVHSRSKTCPTLPQALCEQSVVAVGIFVYVAGGQSQYCKDGRHTQRNVYCLDTRTFQWSKVSPMETPRSLFYMGALGNYLYAVGGWVRRDTVSRSVERYNIVADKWEQVSQLKIGLHEHAGTTQNGQLYISGGFKGQYRGHLDQVWTYRPEADAWLELAPMLQARSYHCMGSTGDNLVVAGGVNYIGDYVFQDVKSCELYTPDTNQWTVISQLPRYASCMSYCILQQSIYIFGGHSFAYPESDHKYLQILNLSTKEWTEKLMVNTNINFFATIITKIHLNIAEGFK